MSWATESKERKSKQRSAWALILSLTWLLGCLIVLLDYSPDLFFTLAGKGINACGTVQPNINEFPKDLFMMATHYNRGKYDYRSNGFLLVWIDKCVYNMTSKAKTFTSQSSPNSSGSTLHKHSEAQEIIFQVYTNIS